MKKLTKILLVNWLYFSKQIIEIDDVNFLTGKNGAGKSTIIDALQIVLLGETKAGNFNQAANEKSQRTLDGYLRADMDENNPSSRRGKDFTSYIACEFFDDEKGARFVAGVAFDCRSDGTNVDHFFIYIGVIPENGFIENGYALDYSDFRKRLKEQYGVAAEFYNTQKEYRTNLLAKWNVHNEQVFRMMKKAVSFRPIVDIQKFITENICDIPDKPDIVAMQQNIRDYKRHEQLAQQQEDKLAALQEISKLYREMMQAIERLQQQSFLVLWAQKEDLEAQNNKALLEQGDCEAKIKSIVAEIDQINEQVQQKDQRKVDLIAACAQSDVSREEDRLRAEKAALIAEQQRLIEQLHKETLALKHEATVLCGICQTIEEWNNNETLQNVIAAANELYRAYANFENCTYDVFAKSLAPFERAQDAISAFMIALRDTTYEVKVMLDGLRNERDQKQAALTNLNKNIKDYPKGLLELKKRLEDELARRVHKPIRIDILADVLELPEAEEQWRRALEGYLNTQKFYLLVPPEHYWEAVQLYDQIKREFGRNSFGLIDIAKLREKERIDPWPDSLAKKVETSNELARSYIDYLLGKVACCSHVDQLRRNKNAITADGMLYQGYVVRPIRKDLMDDAFIGRRAVALRIARIEEDLAQINSNLLVWDPIYQVLSKHQNRDVLLSAHYVQSTITQRQAEYLRGIKITKEIEDVEEKLSHLDLFWLNEQRKIIDLLTEEIAALNDKKLKLSKEQAVREARVHELMWDILPEINQKLVAIEERIDGEFSADFTQNVGIPRYKQEFGRLKKALVVYENFNNRLVQTRRECDTTQQKLFFARSEYAARFRPCSFRIEAMDNDEYAAEQQLLEESELPKYRAKIKAARESAMEQFQNDFLAKLKSSIDQVQDQVKSLNKALDQAQFGTDRYKFRVDRNPDYADYYDMIMAPELMEGDAGLFALPFQQKYGKLIEDLFGRIAMSDDTQLNARKQSELQQNIERYTDFRTYLKFDLETTDQNGSKQLLSQTLNTKSGGETQTPFYIAVLASFAQLYQVNNVSGFVNNTVRLVVFDEAFNKMDSERIIESVRLLRKMGLQAIICTPPDKLPDIMPLADRTLLVNKDKYKMHVLPWSKRDCSI